MKRSLMTDQTTRLNRARLIGMAVAFPLGAWLPLLLTFSDSKKFSSGNFSAILGLGGAASVSAGLAITLIYMRAMRRQESRKRGFWFGVLTGLTALFIMATLIGWAVAILQPFAAMNHGVEASGAMPQFLTVIMQMLSLPFAFTLAGFIFGGFLVLPAGGLLGWLFSRNPEPQTPAKPSAK